MSNPVPHAPESALPNLAGRAASLAYGLTVYALFQGTFLLLIAFVSDLPFVPGVSGGIASDPVTAVAVDLGLIALFGIQHAIMARPAFKRRWTRFCPPQLERSTFVLATCIVLAALFAGWHEVGGVLWQVEGPAAWALWGLAAVGWGTVLLSTFLIDHFELFGLKQVWSHFRGRPMVPARFVERSLYRVVRHPLMLGIVIAFWSTPRMTGGHLVLALGFTAYILAGLWLEERTLIGEHGDSYREYRRRVPMLIPWRRARS